MRVGAMVVGIVLSVFGVLADGDTLERPAPVGTVFHIAVSDTEVWDVSVVNAHYRRGTITAKVEVTNSGTEPGYVSGRFKFGIVGPDGLGIRPDDTCSKGAESENDPFFVDVFPGATAVAYLCWPVEDPALQEDASVIFYAHAINRGSGQSYYYVDLLNNSPTATPFATPVTR